MHWIPLALLAPFFWASSNFIDKIILHKHTKGIFDFLFFSTISSWLFVIILFLIIGMPRWNLYSLIPILTGIVLIYSYGFYGKALEQGDTSRLVILFKLVPVMTVILAFVFLQQTLSLKEMVGFVIVLTGGVMVSFEKSKRSFTKGFGMILIAIFLWSILTLFADYGLTKISFWEYVLLDNLGSALAGLPLFIIPSIRKQVINGITSARIAKYLWFTGNNLTDFFGHMIFIKALAIAPSAGLVTVVVQVQSFYSILIGIILTLLVPFVIKEDISGAMLLKKCLGALIMFSGVYLLLI